MTSHIKTTGTNLKGKERKPTINRGLPIRDLSLVTSMPTVTPVVKMNTELNWTQPLWSFILPLNQSFHPKLTLHGILLTVRPQYSNPGIPQLPLMVHQPPIHQSESTLQVIHNYKRETPQSSTPQSPHSIVDSPQSSTPQSAHSILEYPIPILEEKTNPFWYTTYSPPQSIEDSPINRGLPNPFILN